MAGSKTIPTCGIVRAGCVKSWPL
jgi:hypothetical protein